MPSATQLVICSQVLSCRNGEFVNDTRPPWGSGGKRPGVPCVPICSAGDCKDLVADGRRLQLGKTRLRGRENCGIPSET